MKILRFDEKYRKNKGKVLAVESSMDAAIEFVKNNYIEKNNKV